MWKREEEIGDGMGNVGEKGPDGICGRRDGRWEEGWEMGVEGWEMGRRDGSALTVAANGYDVVTAVVKVVALGITVAA